MRQPRHLVGGRQALDGGEEKVRLVDGHGRDEPHHVVVRRGGQGKR
jgi:hypothetical protein